jgi:hypothetical protein
MASRQLCPQSLQSHHPVRATTTKNPPNNIFIRPITKYSTTVYHSAYLPPIRRLLLNLLATTAP